VGAAFLGVFKFLEIEEAQVLGTGCLSPLDCSVSKKVAQVFRALRTKTRSEHRKHLSGYGVNQELTTFDRQSGAWRKTGLLAY